MDHKRLVPEGRVPLIEVEGTARVAGEQLGDMWRHTLRESAARATDQLPFWLHPQTRPLVEEIAPHLIDLHQGMAVGANLPENRVGELVPLADAGCTSFGVEAGATLDGVPFCGQSKDTSAQRITYFQVLHLKLSDGPDALTLTYPGWLFGHGFVAGGCALFRNALWIKRATQGLPYHVFGLLALHCPTVEAVRELLERHGVRNAFHLTIMDSAGNVMGVEHGAPGSDILMPEENIYVHANAIIRHPQLRTSEAETEADLHFHRTDSEHRVERLLANLRCHHGSLTPQLAQAAITNHANYPASLCRHQEPHAMTTAVAIAEPSRGLLHVTLGPPCMNWPHTYRL